MLHHDWLDPRFALEFSLGAVVVDLISIHRAGFLLFSLSGLVSLSLKIHQMSFLLFLRLT